MRAARLKNTLSSRTAGTARKLIVFLLLLSMLAVSLPVRAEADDAAELLLDIYGSFEIESTREMLQNINDLRANDAWYWNEDDTAKITVSGLQPLAYDYGLERVAMQRAAELAVRYAHMRPDGTPCQTASSYYMSSYGENIAYGYTTADSMFTGWAEADEPYAGQGHRRNMLDSSFKAVGIGCFRCNGILFWAQEFSGTPTGAAENPLSAPVTIHAKQEMVSGAQLKQQKLVMAPGDSLDPVSELGFYIKDAQSPYQLVSCVSQASDYRVDNTDVVKIVDGQLCAVAEGVATVTATVSELTASAQVSVQQPGTIVLGFPFTVDIPAGEIRYVSFVPQETGKYVICSTGNGDTYGYLCDQDKAELQSDDDSGEDYNFMLRAALTAGTQYYIGVRFYNGTAGSVSLIIDTAPENEVDGLTYELLPDGTASITGCYLTGDIVIPEQIAGYTVSNLAEKLFYGKRDITSVSIPATVTWFGADREDNDWDYVFSYCYELENIYVDPANPSFRSEDGVLFSKDGNTLINYPCSREGEVYHVSAETLCCTSFAGCANLKYLFLDDPDTTWYTYTFFDTHTLTCFYQKGGRTERKVDAEIEEKHEYSSDEDNLWCKLVDVQEIAGLPASARRVEAEAFRGIDVRYLTVPDGCVRIGENAFADSSLEFVSVPEGTVIEPGAFDSGVCIERR